jgi:hypothetical protein
MTKLARKSNKELLFEVLKDPERKSIFTMLVDILTLTVHNKKLPLHYFGKYLFKKGKLNIKDYYSNNYLYYKFKPFFNEKAVIDVVENKLFFDYYYNQFNIPLPKLLMFSYQKLFVADGLNFEINNANNFKDQLMRIFNQNPLFDSIIVKKTYRSYGGDQVYKVFKHQLISNDEQISQLYSEVIKAGFIFQETVKQHPQLNRLNPSSLNTIRLDTFTDKEGKIEVISAYIRMSISNKPVDNISSGGCQVGIKLQSGKLKKIGYQSFRLSGVITFTVHPITKIVFEDFEIPYFKEAKELAIKTAACMPGLRLVGWDVAIGEKGPVLIEGNSDYAMSSNDLTEDGYRTNEVFQKMLRELNYD